MKMIVRNVAVNHIGDKDGTGAIAGIILSASCDIQKYLREIASS